MWSIHPKEYYSAIKRNEVLLDATTWNLKNMTLSARTQTHKATQYRIPFFHLYDTSRIGKSIEIESRLEWGG